MFVSRIKDEIQKSLKDPNFSFVARRSLHTLFAMGTVAVLRIASGIIIARYYGPEVRGWLTNLTAFMAIYIILGNFGIKDAMLKLIPEYKDKYNLRTAWMVYKKSMHLIFGFWILCVLAMLLIAEWQSSNWNVPNLRYYFMAASVFLIFLLLSEFNNYSLRAILKIKVANYNTVATLIARVGGLIILTAFFFDRYNPLYIHFFAVCFAAWLISQISVNKHFKRPSRNQEVLADINYFKILSIAFPMLFVYLGFFINNFAAFYRLPAFASTEMIGIYQTAASVSNMAIMALVAVYTTIQPKISQLHHQGNHNEVRKICVKFSRLTFLLNVPIFLILLFGSKLVIFIMYGEEFLPGYLSLSILTIGQIFNVACGPVAQILNVTGYHKQFGKITVFGALCNLILIYFLIPIWGIEGAAIANTVGVAVWNITGTIFVKKKFGYYIAYLPFLNLNKNYIPQK